MNAPKASEFEIIAFGPGIGESIGLHLGDGDWYVIDSCIHPGASEPVIVEYLRSIGVDHKIAIKGILATHWHDDHIQGLSRLIEDCPQAHFAMSAALNCDEFLLLALKTEAQQKMVVAHSSTTEFARIFETIRKRGKKVPAPSFYAQDAMTIFHSGGHKKSAVIKALSPSAAAITNCIGQISGKLLTSNDTRRFKNLEPNDLSVVVHVSVGDLAVVLGADLENTVSAQFGWNAVMSSTWHPLTRAKVLKVAHHGSENGDHPKIWSDLLEAKPVAVMTPYSRVPLPQATDVTRILGNGCDLYCTSWPPVSKPPRRQSSDATLRRFTKSRRAPPRPPGYIRLRFDLANPSAPPSIKLFGSATKL